jgi:hypothetical protein
VLVLLATFLATGLATGNPGPCTAELFRITRNTNANVVVYEARLSAPGVLDEREPVHPLWIMLAEDGRREELGLLEAAMAYGVEARRREGGEAREISIRARPDMAIRVSFVAGCPVAYTRIADREAVLRQVSVTASGGIVPEVLEVEVIGVVASSGAEVRECWHPEQ